VPETTKTGFAVSVNLVGHAICHHGGNCTEQQPCSCVSPYGNPLFQPQNPNFDPLDPKFVPKVYLYIYKHKKGNQNHIKLEIKTSFYHKSSIHPFFIKLTKQLNSHHNFTIMNTHGINHQQQQQHLIMNSSTI